MDTLRFAVAGGSQLQHELLRLDYSLITDVELPLYYYSVSITGRFVECKEYYSGMPFEKHKKINPEIGNLASYYYSSTVVHTIRAYILGNFTDYAKFITLTFDPKTNNYDLKNLSLCNQRKDNYLINLKKLFPDLKYIIVPELHKSGQIHYHMLVDLPYLDDTKYQIVKNLWTYGLCDIRSYKNIVGSVFYLTKYLTKNSKEPQFKNRRKFYCSNNLKKTIKIRGKNAENIIKKIENIGIKPVFSYRTREPYSGGEIKTSGYLLDIKNRSS